MPVSLTVYDDAQSIGGNKILLEDGETSVFLDFGTPFSTRGKYFEEFLAPRSRAGLLDLIHMGLLPPLRGIYRREMETRPVARHWDSRLGSALAEFRELSPSISCAPRGPSSPAAPYTIAVNGCPSVITFTTDWSEEAGKREAKIHEISQV
ncbi:MAG: hypothetical protein HYY39_07995 [Armatimonadetes bacterium]|nr:hypothetical protein [Armatimonadota bacterium]